MEAMDIQHKAFFSFETASFLEDLSNIAMDVCADGFDDFERNIHASEQLSNATKAALSQVIYQMYCITLESLNRAAANFERYEQLTSMAVPPELYTEQARLECRQLQQRSKVLDKDVSRAGSMVEPGADIGRDLRQMMTAASLQQLEAVNADLQGAA
eukprot:gene12364-12499_t